MPHLRYLANPFVLMFCTQTQLLLDLLDLLRIARELRVSFLPPIKRQNQLTLPISSESLTQLRPLILFSLMTILSGVDVLEWSEFFLKSLVRKVPIPKDASHQSSISQNAYRTQNSPAIPCSSHMAWICNALSTSSESLNTAIFPSPILPLPSPLSIPTFCSTVVQASFAILMNSNGSPESCLKAPQRNALSGLLVKSLKKVRTVNVSVNIVNGGDVAEAG
jgi:hypothetical protein